jgi:hypothetical protein
MLSGTPRRLSIVRVGATDSGGRYGNFFGVFLILPPDVWYMIGTMSQHRAAFGFYFSWYFTR